MNIISNVNIAACLLLAFVSCSYHKGTTTSTIETHSDRIAAVSGSYHPAEKGPCSYTKTKNKTRFPAYMTSVKNIVIRIPSSNAHAPYPVIIVEPGYLSCEANLDDIQNHYASHGFIVLGINNKIHYKINTSSLDNYAKALLQTVRYVVECNKDPSSMLFGRVDTNAIGISGHSMGGGGTIMACDSIEEACNRYIKAAIAMNPFGKCSGSNIKIPILLTASEHDSVCIIFMPGVSSSATDIYYTFKSIPEQTTTLFADFKGMKHNAVIDKILLLPASGKSSVFLPTMVSWLKVYLAGDTSYISYLDTTGTGYSKIKSRFIAKENIPAYIFKQ